MVSFGDFQSLRGEGRKTQTKGEPEWTLHQVDPLWEGWMWTDRC
jgi:hypothetical protein